MSKGELDVISSDDNNNNNEDFINNYDDDDNNNNNDNKDRKKLRIKLLKLSSNQSTESTLGYNETLVSIRFKNHIYLSFL